MAGTVLVVAGSIAIASTLDDPETSGESITDPFVATFGGVMALIGTVGLTIGIPTIVGATESRTQSLERMGTSPLRSTNRVGMTLRGKF